MGGAIGGWRTRDSSVMQDTPDADIGAIIGSSTDNRQRRTQSIRHVRNTTP